MALGALGAGAGVRETETAGKKKALLPTFQPAEIVEQAIFFVALISLF